MLKNINKYVQVGNVGKLETLQFCLQIALSSRTIPQSQLISSWGGIGFSCR